MKSDNNKKVDLLNSSSDISAIKNQKIYIGVKNKYKRNKLCTLLEILFQLSW